MTYRPYPSTDRARHQLDRHTQAPRVVDAYAALRSWGLTSEEAVRNTARNITAIGESLRSVQPGRAQAMANVAAALRVLPSVRALSPAAPDPGSGT